MKIGNIQIDNDTIEVVVFATIATTVIILFTGAGALANLWNKQANSNLPQVHYSHDSFAAAAHGDHGGDHAEGGAAAGEHAAPAAH